MRAMLISLVGTFLLGACGDGEPPVAVGSESASGSSTASASEGSGLAETSTTPPDVGPTLPEGCGDGVPESGVYCFELIAVKAGSAEGVTALDLDGDGADELIVGVDESERYEYDGRCAGEVDVATCTFVYRWDGTAMVEATQAVGSIGGGYNHYFAHTDVDGDRRTDVVVKQELQTGFGFRLVGDDMTFGSYTEKYPDAPPLPVGDDYKGGSFPFNVDGEGHVDLLVSFAAGLQMYTREADEWISRGPMLPPANCMMLPVGRGDLDEDGIEDLVVLGQFDACDVAPKFDEDPDFFAMQAFRSNRMTGQLDALPLIYPGRIIADDFWVADLDGDNHLDVLFHAGYVPEGEALGVSLARGRGDGTFEEAERWEDVEVLDLGDLDGDGDVDLVLRGTDEYSIATADALDTAGEIGWSVERDPELSDYSGHSPRAIGDFNGDGVADIAVTISELRRGVLGEHEHRTAVWISRP